MDFPRHVPEYHEVQFPLHHRGKRAIIRRFVFVQLEISVQILFSSIIYRVLLIKGDDSMKYSCELRFSQMYGRCQDEVGGD
jgi:hypothetical protein